MPVAVAGDHVVSIDTKPLGRPVDRGGPKVVFSGVSVLTPRVFDLLEERIRHNLRERGEFQLTSCLDELRKEEGFSGCMIKGRRFDVGLPEAYRQAMKDFRHA